MERHTLHKLRNGIHSAVLIFGMVCIAAACAWTLWGIEGALGALAGVGLAMVLSPSIPPAFVLSLYRARPLRRSDFPGGYAVLDELARRAQLPRTPQLYYVPSSLLNAFAVGNRQRAAIAVTDGMLRALSLRELTGVLAHEVSHVANNDLWIMNLADAMSRATTFLSYVGIFLLFLNLPLAMVGTVAVPWLLVLLLIIAPTLMSLMQLALSRAREYDADLDAATLTGDPSGLAAALDKLERYQGRFWESLLFPGRRIPEPSLLRTHPSTEERIRRLLELRGEPPTDMLTPPERLMAPLSFRVIRTPPR